MVWRDQRLVAINKPSGLLVHRTQLDRRETRFAVEILRDQLGQRVYPLQRLDKPTSGIMLFTLDAATTRLLGWDFAERLVEKTYLAVVRGWPEKEGIIDYPLVDGPKQGSKPVQTAAVAARSARTRCRTLAEIELPIAVGRYPQSRYALVEVCPASGRRHQIRRHFKHIFHPLIGDTRYAEGRHNRLFREQFHCRRTVIACAGVADQTPAQRR